MKKTYYYILFDSHEQAMKLYNELNKAGIRLIVSPTPRSLSICCGVSLRLTDDKYEQVSAFLKSNSCEYKKVCKIEQEFNTQRDVYI